MTISYHTQTIIFKLHFQQVNSTYSKSRRSIDEINASCDQMRSENQLHFCEAWKSHPSISEIQTIYPEMCKGFLNTKYIKKWKEDESLMRNVKISEMIILIFHTGRLGVLQTLYFPSSGTILSQYDNVNINFRYYSVSEPVSFSCRLFLTSLREVYSRNSRSFQFSFLKHKPDDLLRICSYSTFLCNFSIFLVKICFLLNSREQVLVFCVFEKKSRETTQKNSWQSGTNGTFYDWFWLVADLLLFVIVWPQLFETLKNKPHQPTIKNVPQCHGPVSHPLIFLAEIIDT